MSIALNAKHRSIPGWLLPGWLTGAAVAYFITGFLGYFYPSTVSFVILGLCLSVLCAASACWVFGETSARLRANWRTELPNLLVILLAWLLTAGALFVARQYPELYDPPLLSMQPARQPLFLGLAGASLPLTYLFIHRVKQIGSLKTASDLLRENLPGLLLAVPFFFTYIIFALAVNFPGHDTLDQYFDLDISTWLAWLSSGSSPETENMVRAVHPAVLLYLRPLVWFVSIFLGGDRLNAVFVLHALAGAACVFLAWQIVSTMTGKPTYALLMAFLLGASASHLLHGSMLESYIYSALVLLLFVKILQKEPVSLASSLAAGVLIFGITVTNLIQAAILYFFRQPRIKVIVQFMLVVIGAGLLLNVIQARAYPFADNLWLSSLRQERMYQFNLSMSSWRTLGRIESVTRAVFLYSIVAPQPFILADELGSSLPHFRTFKITIGDFHVAGYEGLADVTARVWGVILLGAILAFIWRFIKTRKAGLGVGLVVCLGFNIGLHIVYGDDPMLYSPDWVYALVLFMAIAFERFAGYRWFQLALGGFFVLLMTVNLGLLKQIMEVSVPFYGR